MRKLSSSDEDDNFSNNQTANVIPDPLIWNDVTHDDSYIYDYNFSIGQRNVEPRVPSSCTIPNEYFKLFFTEELIKKIVEETNAYAAKIISERVIRPFSLWNDWKDITEAEMNKFLGVIINMGLVILPDLQSY